MPLRMPPQLKLSDRIDLDQVPHHIAARGMLVGDDWLLDSVQVPATVEGLDVTGINLFASAGISAP
jgi:hypothetical protein